MPSSGLKVYMQVERTYTISQSINLFFFLKRRRVKATTWELHFLHKTPLPLFLLISSPIIHLTQGTGLSLPSEGAAEEGNGWEENKWILPRVFCLQGPDFRDRRNDTQLRGWNEPWVCSPPQALSGLMSGEEAEKWVQTIRRGAWNRFPVMVMLHCRGRNRTNLLMSNVFQKQSEGRPSGTHHESKGNRVKCQQKSRCVCMVRKCRGLHGPSMILLRHPYLYLLPFSPWGLWKNHIG